MECPYCHNEMKCGFLQSARPIIWCEKKKDTCFGAIEDGDIKVSEGLWNGCYAASHYCHVCKKIVIE